MKPTGERNRNLFLLAITGRIKDYRLDSLFIASRGTFLSLPRECDSNLAFSVYLLAILLRGRESINLIWLWKMGFNPVN